MAAGTVWSISASRLGAPRAASMAAVSSLIGADVAMDEFVALFERAERKFVGHGVFGSEGGTGKEKGEKG
jgi:phosphate/sulfate permease